MMERIDASSIIARSMVKQPVKASSKPSGQLGTEVNRSGELEVFVLVAELGSFSEAARKSDVSPSAVSKIVARLEARLGVQLLQRSTRHLQLTAEGRKLADNGKRVLADLSELESSVSASSKPRGVVRINASTATGQLLLLPLVPKLMQTHPELVLDLSFTDHVVDLIEARADIAIRGGSLPSSGNVARLLGHTRQVIAASPAYLERVGRPRHPDDLKKHVRIGWNYHRAVPYWPMCDKKTGERLQISIGDALRVNDGEAMRNLAVQGAGLARLSLYHAWDDLRAGRLEVVLEDFNANDLEPIHALYVGKPGHLPLRTRAVLDFLKEHVDLSHAESVPADFLKLHKHRISANQ